MTDLSGKTIIITAGRPKEVLDGVRHYANHSRPEDHGLRVAEELTAQGAKVIIISPNGRKIVTAEDMMAAFKEEVERSNPDIALQLASVSSIRPASVSEHKLKVKSVAGAAVTLDVVGNIDVPARMKALLPGKPIAGYDNYQQWFSEGDAPAIALIREIAERALVGKTPAEATQGSGKILLGGKLSGKKIIITSGPTAETLTETGDVITNFSSGKQGLAIAESLRKMGADVIYVTGPTKLADPDLGIVTLHVKNAVAMRDACVKHLRADAFIGVAAVADFGVVSPLAIRLSESEAFTLQLQQNPDILQTMGTHPTQRPTAVIGFAAETKDLILYATGKLEKKGADGICANEVGGAMIKRGSDRNKIQFVTRDGIEDWPELGKDEVGEYIGERIARILLRQGQIQPHQLRNEGGVNQVG